MKKQNKGKVNYRLFYIAAALWYIASSMAAITNMLGKATTVSAATALCFGTLFMGLGIIYDRKAKADEAKAAEEAKKAEDAKEENA